MAILRYVTVTSATTPFSPAPQSPPTRPTKIQLRNKEPLEWSEGVAPGGPPTTSKLRKYWGGEEEDPLESDEYIWNKDFVGRFKRLIQNGDEDSLVQKSAVKEEPSGFLSLNRVMTLDSLDVDLSEELTKPMMATLQEPVASPTEKNSSSTKWRPAPTRREQEKWDRATKAATGGSEVMFRELRRPRGDPKVLACESREQYFKLKNKLQILTFGVGSIGLVSAYISYSPEITASFGVGFLGSLIYIRMLGTSVDSLADGAKGLIKGAIGQPRLLVPVVLVMIYNRWNGILVPEYGAMNLELVPMLIGFFTYKIATFAQAIDDALSGITRKTQL